jgi:ABC-2 type transport system permease protein
MTVAVMPAQGSLRRGTIDAYNATRRYLIRGKRQPDIIFGSVLFPVVFVVLFGYVFGSSITVPGGNYHSYLMSGLFAQSTLFASANVAVAVATDMNEGVIDRFKTLPIARSSILIGRGVSTMILGLPALAVMIVCALLVGWRPENGIFDAFLGFLLIELFAFALCWLGILVGLIAKSSQSADVLINIPVFLLGFISNVFVDTSKMPVWLRRLRQLEPGVVCRGSRPQSVRQHDRATPVRRVVAGASGDHDDWACADHHCDLRAALRSEIQPDVAVSIERGGLGSL